MREIKFRAVVFDDDNETSLRYNVWPVGDKVYVEHGGFWMRYESIHQYAGLKDKNGKEIYEGDVVRFAVDFPEQPFDDGIVRWADGGFWTSQTIDDLEELLSDELNDLEGEVIGNIYENPNLLQQ